MAGIALICRWWCRRAGGVRATGQWARVRTVAVSHFAVRRIAKSQWASLWSFRFVFRNSDLRFGFTTSSLHRSLLLFSFFFFKNNNKKINGSKSCQNRVEPISTRIRLYKTQTLFFRVVFVSGSRIVSKITNHIHDKAKGKAAAWDNAPLVWYRALSSAVTSSYPNQLMIYNARL
jgi:hypothetical protein